MQLLVSRSYPVIDTQTLTEHVVRDALFRTDSGSYFLYMASDAKVEGEERLLFLDCRDALLWLNEAPNMPGSRRDRESELSFPKRCLVYFKDEPRMTELEVLDRDIGGLKELLRVAWKDLASPLLTPFERCEARNQMKQCSAELRRNLQTLKAERRGCRKQSLAEHNGRSFDTPKLRLLSGGW